MNNAKTIIAKIIWESINDFNTNLSKEDIEKEISKSQDKKFGDISWPVFSISKTLKKPPQEISIIITEKIKKHQDFGTFFECVNSVGPYINIKCNFAFLKQNNLKILEKSILKSYGSNNSGENKIIGIDYSSPNIAKPFGIGHLRSTTIGNAISNIYKMLGYKVIGINHLGDWGTQFGKLIFAFEKWGSEEKLSENPIQHLYELYVLFHSESENNKELDDFGRQWFNKLENGDPKAIEYWHKFRNLSLLEFKNVYNRIGISFDYFWGESHYIKEIPKTIQEIKKLNIIKESDGVLVANFANQDIPSCPVLKSDGTTLYTTRDIAAAIYRYENFKFDKFIYVVGSAQELHFKQVFEILKQMNLKWASDLIHVSFGIISGISTRKGTLVFLNDIIDRGKNLALEMIKERNTIPENEKEKTAEQIAIGAIIFQDLSRDRIKDYEFDWNQMLRGIKPGEPGKTGPYLQYTYVRLKGIEENYEKTFNLLPSIKDLNINLLSNINEQNLIDELEKFPKIIEKAAEEYEPSLISRYLLDLASLLNTYYSSGEKIISEDLELSKSRIVLISSVKNVLGIGLKILGIPIPNKM